MSKCEDCKKDICDCRLSSKQYDRGYQQGRADAIDELKMLFKLSISEKPNRTINECEAEIIFRNLKKQIKERKNE